MASLKSRPLKVAIQAKLLQSDDRLTISYLVRNECECPIYIFDLMPKRLETGRGLDLDRAYVFWEEPLTARVVRGVLDTPPGLHVVIREIPFARRIPPNAPAVGRIVLKMPVDETSPFYSPTDKVQIIECRRLRLMLGWLEEQAGLVATPRVIGDQHGFILSGWWAGQAQRLAELNSKIEPMRLRVRQDGFCRNMPME